MRHDNYLFGHEEVFLFLKVGLTRSDNLPKLSQFEKRILKPYPEWWRDGPCEARQPVMSQVKTLCWCQFPRNKKSIPRDET